MHEPWLSQERDKYQRDTSPEGPTWIAFAEPVTAWSGPDCSASTPNSSQMPLDDWSTQRVQSGERNTRMGSPRTWGRYCCQPSTAGGTGTPSNSPTTELETGTSSPPSE